MMSSIGKYLLQFISSYIILFDKKNDQEMNKILFN